MAGRSIHLFEPAAGSVARRAFARLVVQLSERDLEPYWLEQALSGGPLPQREFASAEELVRHVAVRQGAVAYLEWEAWLRVPQRGVKVVPLRVDGRRLLPREPDYPLRTREDSGLQR